MKVKTKGYTRFFSLLLSIIMILGLSLIAGAEEINNNTTNNHEIIMEDTSRREQYSKHFLTKDGSYIAATYAEPVHYNKDGKWIDIDNTLNETKNEAGETVYENKDNSFKVKFGSSADNNKIVTINSDKHEISWSIDTEKKSLLSSKNMPAVTNFDKKSLSALSENDKLMSAGKASSKITYSSIYDGIDLNYSVNSQSLKEDIVLNKPTQISTFSFNINTNGLSAKLNEDNTVSLFDLKDPNKTIFLITAPFMYDSSKEKVESTDIKVNLFESKDGYKYIITPDSEWLNAKERVYPVYIDPTTNQSDTMNMDDTYIHPGDSASHNHYAETTMYVGTKSGVLNRSFLRFKELPNIYGGYVTGANLSLRLISGTSTWKSVSIYKLNTALTDMNSSYKNITWSSNGISRTYLSSCSAPSNMIFNWSVTSAVRDWYEYANTNYGFMLAYTNESDTDWNQFYTSNMGTITYRPIMTIAYEYHETEGINNGFVYYIKSVHSGKYMDVENWADADGTNVSQFQWHGNTNQQWRVTYKGNNDYVLQSLDSYKLLSICGSSASPTANAWIWHDDGTSGQRFKIRKNDDGTYSILSECSNYSMVLDVDLGSSNGQNNGDNIQQFTDNRTQNQKWTFERAYYGVAWGFKEKNNWYAGPPNCFGYALGVNYKPVLYMEYNDSVYTVANRVISCVNGMGRNIRIINGPTAPIGDSEYRFCMRVGNHKGAIIDGIIVDFDYHFWVQTNTGAWSEKHGGNEVTEYPIFINPSTANWNCGSYVNFYDSPTIYFAATLS